ncbi:MAG TPA: DUF2188 domain-containing protein [Candidatus Paceibacterota bacterium]|nr:DUF2188 domain-containing protein [Candidatus Paceibacterota bacterium]
MPARRIFNVAPTEGSWRVSIDGGASDRSFDRKEQAVRWARERARGAMPSQLRIKGRNGRIQTEHTYGGDPRSRKG